MYINIYLLYQKDEFFHWDDGKLVNYIFPVYFIQELCKHSSKFFFAWAQNEIEGNKINCSLHKH